MSFDWLQHAFFDGHHCCDSHMIIDVCVSKLKTILKFLIEISFKNICLIILKYQIFCCSQCCHNQQRENLTQLFR